MIDWLTCQIALPPGCLPAFGREIRLDPCGEVIADKVLGRSVASSDTSTWVQSWGDNLMLSGNPAKFLQGQNIYAPDDFAIVGEWVRRVLWLSGCATDAWRLEKITRMDITYSYLLLSRADVSAALDYYSQCTADRFGRARSRHGTLYWGTPSRAQIKMYDKYLECKNARAYSSDFLGSIPPLLRCELTLGRKFFEEHDWKNLLDAGARQCIWEKFMDRIHCNDHPSTVDISSLPRPLQKIYGLWLAGLDLRQIYKINTINQYASRLRRFGVDIFAPVNTSSVSIFRRRIELVPYQGQGCPGSVWSRAA